MNYLINLYNQVGAGPRNISLNLVSELRKITSSEHHFYVIVPDFEDYKKLVSSRAVTLVKLTRYESLLMKIVFRIYLDFIFLPQLLRAHKIESVLAFGNFLIAPIKARKTVLLHHPYIFDDRQLARLPFISRMVERAKRMAFYITLRNVDNVVVQSKYVYEKLKEKWPWFRGRVHIIENPVSSRLGIITEDQLDCCIEARRVTICEKLELLYVSRYYPHKNHGFLLPLSRALLARGVCHRILITVDPDIPGATKLLDEIKDSGLPIENLGEIDQSMLRGYYLQAHALVFPSRAETFGNPLLEAMGFGLPVVAPDLDYAHAVLAETGLYYIENDANDCASKILMFFQADEYYRSICHNSIQRFSKFFPVNVWVQKYLELISADNKYN